MILTLGVTLHVCYVYVYVICIKYCGRYAPVQLYYYALLVLALHTDVLLDFMYALVIVHNTLLWCLLLHHLYSLLLLLARMLLRASSLPN